MSYLYNLYEGSLADLSTAFDQVDLTDPTAVTAAALGEDPDPDDVEDLGLDEGELDAYVTGPLVLAGLIEQTWSPSPGELLNWLDWHEEDELLERAGDRLSERGSGLLGRLFTARPLGVEPLDWGFQGSLTHPEVIELRDELVAVLPPEVVDAVPAPADQALADGWPIEVPLSWVLVSLRKVTDGRDVAVRLG